MNFFVVSGSCLTFPCIGGFMTKKGYFVDDDVGYIDLALLAFWEMGFGFISTN